MTFAKRLSISFAAIATAITVGALGSDPAQAITITGSVTGTWDYNFGQGANVNVGDTFTADYSYDDATLTYFDYSLPGYNQYSGYYGPLLSLIVNSGSYSHTFDVSNSQFSLYDFIEDPSNLYYSYKHFQVFGDDYTAPVSNHFYAYKQVGESDGEAFDSLFAHLFTYDYNTDNFLDGVEVDAFNDVQFTPDPTAVPEPALLTGLIGLGVFVLRKRKAEVAKQTCEV